MAKDKCPVCDDDLDANAVAVSVNGRSVKVCCEECAAAVKADPGKFAAA